MITMDRYLVRLARQAAQGTLFSKAEVGMLPRIANEIHKLSGTFPNTPIPAPAPKGRTVTVSTHGMPGVTIMALEPIAPSQPLERQVICLRCGRSASIWNATSGTYVLQAPCTLNLCR